MSNDNILTAQADVSDPASYDWDRQQSLFGLMSPAQFQQANIARCRAMWYCWGRNDADPLTARSAHEFSEFYWCYWVEHMLELRPNTQAVQDLWATFPLYNQEEE